MTFKIDTKEHYAILIPENELINANMAEELLDYIKNKTQNDIYNFIIDCSNICAYDINANDSLLSLHEFVYGSLGGSLVFTSLNNEVYNKIKQERLHLNLNITPTLIEAVDIINMEVLERDLLGEE